MSQDLETQLLTLTGTETVAQALCVIRHALCPLPVSARVGIMWDDVEVTTGHAALAETDYEQRTLRARARFRDGTLRTYSESFRIAHKHLHHHGQPDMLRHHHDNRMRNAITQRVMQDAS